MNFILNQNFDLTSSTKIVWLTCCFKVIALESGSRRSLVFIKCQSLWNNSKYCKIKVKLQDKNLKILKKNKQIYSHFYLKIFKTTVRVFIIHCIKWAPRVHVHDLIPFNHPISTWLILYNFQTVFIRTHFYLLFFKTFSKNN